MSDLIAVPTIGDARWLVTLGCGHAWIHVEYLMPGMYLCGCPECPRSFDGFIPTREITRCVSMNMWVAP